MENGRIALDSNLELQSVALTDWCDREVRATAASKLQREKTSTAQSTH
jgi:hypothetical protein